MIHHNLQATNSGDTQYLMPHVAHVMENMRVVQLLVLKLLLNIGTSHLPQLFKKCPLSHNISPWC